MKFLYKIFKSKPDRGDTIVEVMIATTILTMAIVGAYSLGSLSLRTATESNQRVEALTLAQSQVDLLTAAKNNNTNFASDYELPSPYCINNDESTSSKIGSDKLCDDYAGSVYNVGVTFDSSSQVFTITAQWPSGVAANGLANLNLYYKLPGVYQPATVATNAATNVNVTSATLNGSVNPGGITVDSCYFVYGTTISYGSQVNCPSIPSGSTNQNVSASVSGLSANTIYHFKLCITNIAGVACGDDQSFTTKTLPAPTVNTDAATAVTSSSATLNGDVNPNGNSLSSCYFNFSLGGGNPVTQTNCSSVPSGSGDQSVSASKTGLSAGTTYWYQLCVWYSAGPVCGSNANFTTSKIVPIVAMTHVDEFYNNGRGNGQLDLSGTVNDQNVSGTTAWFEESCDNSDWSSCNGGAFPTPQQAVPTNNGNNGESQTVFPWTFYYYGFHNDYYFRICAQNSGGKTCSAGADLSNSTKVWP